MYILHTYIYIYYIYNVYIYIYIYIYTYTHIYYISFSHPNKFTRNLKLVEVKLLAQRQILSN